MKLIVFGANGPTGRILTRRALEEGHEVVAFTRSPDSFPVEHTGLEVVAGDVHDRTAVEAAIDGTDAVLCTLGVPFAKTPISGLLGRRHQHHRRDAHGRDQAARLRHLQRGRAPPRAARRLLLREGDAALRRRRSWAGPSTTTCDGWKRSCARAIWPGRSSGRRACSRHPRSRPTQIALDHIGHRFTSRTDLADCLLRQATDDQYVQATIAVATTTIKPNMLKLIWREGIRKKK